MVLHTHKVVVKLIMSINRPTVYENKHLSTKLNIVYSKMNSRLSSSVTAG